MKSNFKILMLAVAVLIAAGCQKADEVFDAPYQTGKAPLGILVNDTKLPNPANGAPGTTVEIAATGLLPYKDKLVFNFNGEPAEILEVTATSIKVKVPDNASSGVTSVMVDDRIVFGPVFKVDGLIAADPTFRATKGANGTISAALQLVEGKYIFVGDFTNYDDKGLVSPINRIVRTSIDGDIDRTFRSGTASNGYLSGIIQIGNQFIISGAFSGYNQRKENISNITRINLNGSIDTMGIKTFRPPLKKDTIKYFPKFNGGTDGAIEKLYTFQGRIIGTGNFRYYITRTYDKPNKYQTGDSVILDSTEVRQIIRLNPDGTLDKTYRFNTTTDMSLAGANGNVSSYMHPGTGADVSDGKLVVFGNFSTFDGVAAGRIIRLKADGTIDPTFNVGLGANNTVGSVTYNAVTGKYLVTGSFRTFNGDPTEGIVLLNLDGSTDKSFVSNAFVGGSVRGAKQLSDGLIVVYGDFKKYGNYTRNGFMVLKPNGALAAGYNATGIFNGSLSDVIETKSADGKRALLLIGGFNRFNGEDVQNITRVTIE